MLLSVHSWMWLSKTCRGRLHTLHHVSPYHQNWHSPRPLQHNTVRCFTIKQKLNNDNSDTAVSIPGSVKWLATGRTPGFDYQQGYELFSPPPLSYYSGALEASNSMGTADSYLGVKRGLGRRVGCPQSRYKRHMVTAVKNPNARHGFKPVANFTTRHFTNLATAASLGKLHTFIHG
jgi:hypothetical protein